MTFSVDSVAYLGKVTTLASGAITGTTLHGSSTETKSGASDSTTATEGSTIFSYVSRSTFKIVSGTRSAELMNVQYIRYFISRST
ncbi:MAG: hypothetical protein OSA42_01695 [Porticoccaceae bacterium]|nr:hypothetical protein [Porticoccaceae bacterium]